jgi:hypothetical protein
MCMDSSRDSCRHSLPSNTTRECLLTLPRCPACLLSPLTVVDHSLQIQFDNRGSKVEGKKSTLIAVVARMLKVDPKSVSMNVIGQSGLLNHQVCLGVCRGGPAGAVLRCNACCSALAAETSPLLCQNTLKKA